jgi:hypothetical protein
MSVVTNVVTETTGRFESWLHVGYFKFLATVTNVYVYVAPLKGLQVFSRV